MHAVLAMLSNMTWPVAQFAMPPERDTGKERLYQAAFVIGLAAAFYIRIYWGTFYVNPFPELKPIQLLGFAINSLIGYVIIWAARICITQFSHLQPSLKSHSERKDGHSADTRKNSNAEAQCHKKANRHEKCWPKPMFWRLLFELSFIYIAYSIGTAALSTGPLNNLFHNPIAMVIACFTVSMALRNGEQFARFPALGKEAFNISIWIIVLASSLALSRANQVWDGGNLATVELTSGASKVYGFIGELGGKTYLLETSGKGSSQRQKVVSIPSSLVKSVLSPAIPGKDFRFGP